MSVSFATGPALERQKTDGRQTESRCTCIGMLTRDKNGQFCKSLTQAAAFEQPPASNISSSCLHRYTQSLDTQSHDSHEVSRYTE